MASRSDLNTKLKELLGNDHVYFQPPESVKLQYPCIVYRLDTGDTQYAADMPYTFARRYNLTFISKNPDSELIDKIAMSLPSIRLDRYFPSDNLNHYVYKLYW